MNAAVLKTVVRFARTGGSNPSPSATSVHYVYVLKSVKDGKLYTGVTKDVGRRLREHNAGRTRSLRGRRPLLLVFTEQYQTKKDAMARERFFKTPRGGLVKQALAAKAIKG